MKVDLWQACSAFYVVCVTLATFGLQAGNMKFYTQDEG
jgi:O-antigen/teichoic acid export membrane protein